MEKRLMRAAPISFADSEPLLDHLTELFRRSVPSGAQAEHLLARARLDLWRVLNQYAALKPIHLANAATNAELTRLAQGFASLAKKLDRASPDIKAALRAFCRSRKSWKTERSVGSFASNEYDLPGISQMLNFLAQQWGSISFPARGRGSPTHELERTLIRAMAQIWKEATASIAMPGKRAKQSSQAPKFADLVEAVAKWINDGLGKSGLRIGADQWARATKSVLGEQQQDWPNTAGMFYLYAKKSGCLPVAGDELGKRIKARKSIRKSL